ncbi:hypothetical protein GCM10012275_58220 [Longimycelium tulufanense]|uniref:DUF3073 domain-containing protein n=1 Tax=Longimycelium tulufanense TaxID=907463 RepID=A0A8J3CE11_9PSEU|nr:DUF3073 family protein [Longimycelium tulufanense]GGM79987.1 hypothetical protein GCM10012275_58220 [Longimycelium tulufanense]
MGRGRAKAKQTKIARKLKYSSHALDVGALQLELSDREPNDAQPAHQGAGGSGDRDGNID